LAPMNLNIVFSMIAVIFLGTISVSIPSQLAFAQPDFDICRFFPEHPKCQPIIIHDLCTLVPCPDPCIAGDCLFVLMPWERVFEDLPILVAAQNTNQSMIVTKTPDKSVAVLQMPTENILDGSAGQIIDELLRNETLLMSR
jgi:hypothetical protein